MKGKRAPALVAFFILTIVSLILGVQIVSPPKIVYAAEPAQAAGLSTWLEERLSGVEAWTGKIWDAATCVTDIDCLITNATVSFINNEYLILVGTTFDDLSGEKVKAMMEGNWNTGIAFSASTAIDSAYSDPPGLNEVHFASYVKRELSDNLLSGGARAQSESAPVFSEEGPVYKIWKAVRNITYGLFLAVMIAVGFMIMFRKQTPARVAISFTSALPKIFLSLLLITFSFDLVVLAYDVIASFGSTLIFKSVATEDTEAALNRVFQPSKEEAPSAGGIIGSVGGTGANVLTGHFLTNTLLPLFDKESGTKALRALFIGGITLTAWVIALIAVVVQLFFRISKILFSAAISPLIFLIGSLPGQEGTIGKFVQSLIADCIAFPVIAFLLAFTITYTVEQLTIDPATVDPRFGTLIGGLGASIVCIMLMVMTFIAPSKIANIINPKKG